MKPEFINMIDGDIARIDTEIKNGSPDSRWNLFRELDGRYQACIEHFYQGMWQSSHSGDKLFFPQLKNNPSYVIDNLKLIKSKLETFRFGMNAVSNTSMLTPQVNVNTTINISLTFDQARSNVENMDSLTNEQTQEALNKINELEEILKSTDSKKSKWEKAKPVLSWLANKSFELAKVILPLLLQIQQ